MGNAVFGLMWNGREAALAATHQPAAGWLEPTGGDDHQLVSGDNLDALKLLALEGVECDLIYMDPPYNTGNNFVYQDRFSGRTASPAAAIVPTPFSDHADAGNSKRAKWATFIYPRLVAGRELLTSQGACYVSIDHNEAHTLRTLMDEVFGPNNFIADISVSLNPKGRQLDSFFATSHETLLVYARDIGNCALVAASAADVNPTDFPHTDDSGRRYRLLPLRNTNKKFNPVSSPTMHYPLHVDTTTGEVDAAPFEGSQEVSPVFGDGNPAVWRWSRAKVSRDRDSLVAREVNGNLGPRVDVFQKDRLTAERKKKMKTVWDHRQAGSTDNAVEEIKARIGHVFETPKPTKLLRRILETMPDDAVVLDYFAGSGTTGEAVLQQNAVDGGSRTFILVEIDQPVPADSAAGQAGHRVTSDITSARVSKAAAESGSLATIAYRQLIR